MVINLTELVGVRLPNQVTIIGYGYQLNILEYKGESIYDFKFGVECILLQYQFTKNN